MAKTKRVQWRLRYIKADRGWECRKDGAFKGFSKLKKSAVANAVWHCRLHLSERGELAELTIHRKDGTIQDKRTYGADPRRSKG